MDILDDDDDDVSALSMDGASAIAGHIFARRLRKDFAEMQLGIPEHEEEQQQRQQAAASGQPFDGTSQELSSSNPLLQALLQDNNNNNNNDGDELIEPFPKTFEEWQKKKEKKKHKHKSRKHHKKSSKSGSHSRSHSRSSRHKEREQQQQLQQQLEQEIMGEEGATSKTAAGAAAPPIMEISIQSTNFEQTLSTQSPGLHSNLDIDSRSSYHSSVASTASSSNSHSKTSSSQQQQHHHHHHRHGRSNRPLPPDLRSSIVTETEDDSTTRTGHDSRENTYVSHMTGQSSNAHSQSQSHITVEDLQTLTTHLERSRSEERQVLEIHSRLQREVTSAVSNARKAEEVRAATELELRMASSEREELTHKMNEVEMENEVLRVKLRNLEDRETEEGLDDVLDSMEAKIKALKLKGRRSREKKKKRSSAKDK